MRTRWMVGVIAAVTLTAVCARPGVAQAQLSDTTTFLADLSNQYRVVPNVTYHVANNHENFAAEGATVANVPSGTGILILGADDVEVTSNSIVDNKTCGVAVLSLASLIEKERAGGVDVDPWPDRVRVHDNEFEGNGRDPDPAALEQGISGSDLLWDVSGEGNSWSERGASSKPAFLPGPSWGEGRRRFFRRLWRALGA